jgi:hypothetical protein
LVVECVIVNPFFIQYFFLCFSIQFWWSYKRTNSLAVFAIVILPASLQSSFFFFLFLSRLFFATVQ